MIASQKTDCHHICGLIIHCRRWSRIRGTISIAVEEQEEADILSVRRWCKAAHVEDGDALQCFGNGQGVFDVSADGMKLDQFLRRYKLLKCYQNSFMGLCGNRAIHMAFRMESIH